MVDRDLAVLYGVPTRHLNQQVKRNRSRFPSDFAFQLTDVEAEDIRVRMLGPLGSWRGKSPYAFTELGAGMLAAVLRSAMAAVVTVEILRAFKQARRAEEPAEYSTFARQCRTLFDAIRDAVLLLPDDRFATTEVACTYFLQAGKEGPIKIGSTRNLLVRLRTLATMSPIPLTLLGVMKGDHEESCHHRLGAFRTHGEWFAPTVTVLKFIRENCIHSVASPPMVGFRELVARQDTSPATTRGRVRAATAAGLRRRSGSTGTPEERRRPMA